MTHSSTPTQKLSPERFKTLEEVIQFNPRGYVKRSIFETSALQLGIYCFEPGQANSMHCHPQSGEICYVIQGTGEVVIEDEVAAIAPGVLFHASETTQHEIRNTGTEQMLILVVQAPLPCQTERSSSAT